MQIGAVSGPYSLPTYCLDARDQFEALDILDFSAELFGCGLADLRRSNFAVVNVLLALEHGERNHLAALPVREPVAALEARQKLRGRDDVVLDDALRVFELFG